MFIGLVKFCVYRIKAINTRAGSTLTIYQEHAHPFAIVAQQDNLYPSSLYAGCLAGLKDNNW